MDYSQFGWICLYVVAFGISDLFVRIYIKSTFQLLFYYLLIACIGIYLLYTL